MKRRESSSTAGRPQSGSLHQRNSGYNIDAPLGFVAVVFAIALACREEMARDTERDRRQWRIVNALPTCWSFCCQRFDSVTPYRINATSNAGSPPTANTVGGPDGLASWQSMTTGSTTAGKHATHATTLGYSCGTCHSNSVMPEVSRVKPGFLDISIAFSTFGTTTGSYSGQAGVSYNHALGTGGLTCSTVYCHGNTLDGANKTPAWTGSVACGDCHKDPHQGRFGETCTKCHTEVDWKTVVAGSTESRAFHDKTRYPLRGAHVQVAGKFII